MEELLDILNLAHRLSKRLIVYVQYKRGAYSGQIVLIRFKPFFKAKKKPIARKGFDLSIKSLFDLHGQSTGYKTMLYRVLR